ncbi:MAG: hypothetical protein SAK29_01735 [Scytonema sp. PMC 1069.18]|nr:hypothetical protein [Scytonema sp. PMC 1069.18]MEC4884172.1 hypothetical protein [Scytonema sp. PMC 1070.18]
MFEATREKQYTQELLFSTVVGIISQKITDLVESANEEEMEAILSAIGKRWKREILG